MPKENKSTNIEVENRVNEIFTALTKGISSVEMFQYVSEKFTWNVTSRQIYNYVQEANKKYTELAEKNKDVEFGKAVSRLTLLFEKSLKVQDYKTCLAIQKEINTMFGTYEPTKQIIDANITQRTTIIDWSGSNTDNSDKKAD
jgi:hypothetical protein